MSGIYSVHSLPETEATESKCTIFFSFHKRFWGSQVLKTHLALADSVHSVGIMSELTTLETVPPQEARAAQPAIAEPQIDPNLQIGQSVNVPYLPQCTVLPDFQFSPRFLHFPSLIHPDADSSHLVF